jgi:hypothetical protein
LIKKRYSEINSLAPLADMDSNSYVILSRFFLLKGPVENARDAPQPGRLIVQPCDEDDEVFSAFPF